MACAGRRTRSRRCARASPYDLDYLRNWSLALDLRIIWKTIFVVLKRPETAY
jgi:lipopolysaccharide/colanic/teichoic acid biosynthesis glycosyltransferase